jgi:hypothetical protein
MVHDDLVCPPSVPAYEQVENLAFVVNHAPEPELSARDRYGHLIEMPSRCWTWASTPKFSGEQGPKLQNPSSHRFVGDIQTARTELKRVSITMPASAHMTPERA